MLAMTPRDARDDPSRLAPMRRIFNLNAAPSGFAGEAERASLRAALGMRTRLLAPRGSRAPLACPKFRVRVS